MENQTLKKHKITKSSVVETLEVEACKPVHKSFNHNENDKLWCIYMLEKFGDDYVSMTKDHKNYYQYTPKQIKKQINQFKNMKCHYQKYLIDKSNGVNFLENFE